MYAINIGKQDETSDDEWQIPEDPSLPVGNIIPVTQTLEQLSLEREWDLLSYSSSAPSLASDDAFEDQERMPKGKETQRKTLLMDQQHISKARQMPYESGVMDDWRRTIGTETPRTESESGFSELSVISSNAFDPVFFPERNITPTNKRPQRECFVRHGVLCQLCSEEVRGMRWMCKECPQWSVCTDCFVVTAENEVHPVHTFIRIYSPTDIFTVQEQSSNNTSDTPLPFDKSNSIVSQPVIHFDVQCHNCKGSIIGSRYDCAVNACANQSISFCQDCEALPINCHPPTHPLIKYKLAKSFCQSWYPELLNRPESEQKSQKKPAEFSFSDPSNLSRATLPDLDDFVVKRKTQSSSTREWMMDIQDQSSSSQSRKRVLAKETEPELCNGSSGISHLNMNKRRSTSQIILYDCLEPWKQTVEPFDDDDEEEEDNDNDNDNDDADLICKVHGIGY